MWFEDFQDGCHGGRLGYQNGTVLAILNLHAVPMPFTKFPLHPTYCSGADNNWRLSRWPPWRPSWIRFQWRCRKCEKLLTDIRMRDGPWKSKAPGELTIEDLQDGCYGGHSGYRNKLLLAILNLHVTQMPSTKFWLNLNYQMRFEDFQDGHLGGYLRYRTRMILAILNLCCWRPSWILERNKLSNSKSPCHPSASHRSGSIRLTVREQMWLEDFQDGHHCGNLGYQF